MRAPALLLLAAILSPLATGAAEIPWFEDLAARRGIVFEHQDARFGEKYYVETAASGGGFLDFDGDGDLDVYLLNGAKTPGSKLQGEPRNALFENRDGHFVNITEAAGVGDSGYGMGLCAGDVDADGRLDFLVTNYGADRLYRNRGPVSGGKTRFEEISVKAGVDDPRWGASCAFGDLDGDGDLDLYVTHYVDFRFDANPFCGDRARGLRAYCRPEAFDGVADSLFINQGDGTFRDEAAQRGIAHGREAVNEKGFGVVLSDLDEDGDLDIYVANDGTMNRLYLNDGRGRFQDHSLLSGAGLNARGRPESGMGVDLGDADGDGRMDVVVTNYSMESNTLYKNLGDEELGELLFDDITRAAGLTESSFKLVGWGTRLADLDNDGDLDLTVVNGHAVDNIEIFEAGLKYRQPNLLYWNDGRGRFTDVSAQAGPAFRAEKVSRALAVGDVDSDGWLDLLVTNTNEAPELLLNRVDEALSEARGRHWLGIALQGPPSNPLAIGARVSLTAADRTQVREVRSGDSFLAQSDLRLHFGLGSHSGAVQVKIHWPDGRRQTATTGDLNRYWMIAYQPR